MKIIDAHMHFSKIDAFHQAAIDSGVDYSLKGYLQEAADSGIAASVCMGLIEMGVGAFPDLRAPAAMHSDLDNPPENMYICLGINPHSLDDNRIRQIEQLIVRKKNMVGFKIYAGYYHFNICDPVYIPIYKIADRYNLPVAIHTGDVYSEDALLEYSHPLAADRLAVAFRDVNFILCHMGDPWIMDACEVAYKNSNVWVDISGLLAGDEELISQTESRAAVMQHYTCGLVYLNNYKKVLFGTDWPLVPMARYIEFCKKIIPGDFHEDVFCNNAALLFPSIAV
ncbi:MAG: amidohydrolase [Defluviitaleaceae bacterium]|nr:amidohydrolase [Defluviitaleaceae bacterium]